MNRKKKIKAIMLASLAVVYITISFVLYTQSATSQVQEFPALGPLPEVPQTPDNPTTEAKIELGKLLSNLQGIIQFFDITQKIMPAVRR